MADTPLSDTAAETLQEIENPDVEPSGALTNLQLANRELDAKLEKQIEEELNTDTAALLRDSFARLTSEGTPDSDADWIAKKFYALIKGDNPSLVEKAVFDLVTLVVHFLQDFFLIGQYAGIQGERTRLQPLRVIARPTLLDTASTLEYLKRNPGYKSQAYDNLARAGLPDDDITRLIELTKVIPGGMDIVSFMVREVYDPAAVKTFKMDEGFTTLYPQAKTDADRAGVTEEVLRKYWMAHWRLPGINQGYEMLHRGQIDLESLRMLMKASDIMPGFIEPLINISYNPLTRVDVRRIHKLLNKDRSWLVDRYKDIGYNQDNAETMADFTIEYNKDPDGESKTKERDLTKSDILQAYKMDLYTESDTRLALQALGYNRDEAQTLIDRIDWQKELEIVDGYTDAAKRAYIGRLWDPQKTRETLNRLNLPSSYIEYLLDIWTVNRDLKDKMPTKAEILGWFKKGIITESSARDELSALGYETKYVEWYITGTKGGVNADTS